MNLEDWEPQLSGSGSTQAGTRDSGSDEPSGSKSAQPAESPQPTPTNTAVPYVWYDGDRAVRVWLQTDLVLQKTSENTADDVVVQTGRSESIVERRPEHDERGTLPVFRSGGGSFMTLPGGVILVLDQTWSSTQADAFLAEHGIEKSSVQVLEFAANAFLVETDPGFPSLDLANDLAGEDGVEVSSPNWEVEVELQ